MEERERRVVPVERDPDTVLSDFWKQTASQARGTVMAALFIFVVAGLTKVISGVEPPAYWAAGLLFFVWLLGLRFVMRADRRRVARNSGTHLSR
jgi:hypothetical protein